jgi:hypothetical protein
MSKCPPETLVRKARAVRARRIREARKDPAKFSEYVLKDESTGQSIKNAPHHTAWHRHWDSNPFAVMIAPVGHGKTQCSIARILYLLGKNPNRRVALISDTERQAIKILRQVRSYIESSTALHEVFPNLIPSKRDGDPWTNLELVVNRPTLSKDPSVQALGVGGPINGSRIDDMVLDDVVSFESSRTPGQRDKIRDWFDTTALTRLTEDATISVIGTPWQTEDLLHELEKRPGFFSARFSSVLNPDAAPENWKVLWPEKWSKSLLLKRRDNMTPAAFSKKYLCQVVSRETARFKEEWIRQALTAGRGYNMAQHAPRAPSGAIMRCFTGVDLGIAEKDSNAMTCIFTIAILASGKRLVCEVQSGRWTAHEIIQRLQSVYERFDSTIFVEDNGAQRFLVQMCDGTVPVSSWTTTAGRKFHEQYGVESLAAEMARGWWIIPSEDGLPTPEVSNWLDECRNYDPEQHTGDRLMASWIARESLRSGSMDRSIFLDVQSR